jgi:hypothetical protein
MAAVEAIPMIKRMLTMGGAAPGNAFSQGNTAPARKDHQGIFTRQHK